MKAPEHSSETKYPEYSSDQVIESKHSIIKKEKQVDLRNITHSYQHNYSNCASRIEQRLIYVEKLQKVLEKFETTRKNYSRDRKTCSVWAKIRDMDNRDTESFLL